MISLVLALCLMSALPAGAAHPGTPPTHSAHANASQTDTTTAALPYYPDGVQTVTVGGREIAYVERGAEPQGEPQSEPSSRPVLLFVHGLGSNLSLWRDHVDAFPEHRVLALDLPGFGLSEKTDVPATMPFFAKTVTGFLDALNVDRVTYVGVSMGGQVGLHVALDHSERLERLVLVSPAGIETFTDEEAAGIRSMMSAEGIASSTDAQVEQSVALNFATFGDADRWLIEQRHAVAARPDFQAYAQANARAVSGMLDGAVYDRLGAVDVPTLVLFGAGDKLIPNRFLHPNQTPATIADSARAAMPEAQVRLVDDAGHLVMVERPERFRELLRSFLNEDAAGR